jgi:hypothetical protein
MTLPGLAGGGGRTNYAATPVDRLVRKEVALGTIRERPFPEGHIGLTQIAPFLNVATDEVIFDYIKGGLQEGLAPARAEDAESELSQKDMVTSGTGRASVIDWALKDEYSASDVTRFRDDLMIRQALEGAGVQLSGLAFTGNTVADFQARLARDDARRRRMLDNRMEWLIMQAIENGTIVYNDGKIKFTVDYGRPSNQHNQAPAGGLYNTTTHDPIGDLIAVNDFMYNLYGFRFTKAITSQRVLNTFWKSAKFTALAGVVGGTPSAPIDPNYLLPGWGPQYAIDAVERVTGVKFQVYDSIYRSRAVGSTTWVNNRFLSDNKIFLLPNEGDLGEVDGTQIGFAKTLTSPHPEGNWQSGFYEWEDETRDPWMTVRGTGIKAFPVFPYMEYTYSMTVL